MNATLFGITFANLQSLPFFLLLGALIVLVIRRNAARSALIQKLAATKWQSLIVRNYSPLRARIKTILLILGLLFLFITLLHPQWGTKEEAIKQRGRDLFIALDISRSMLAQDMKPNRLEAAQKKIHTLVHSLTAERVGLILFSSSAIVQCPLTTDTSAFFLALDAITPQAIGSGTTRLDAVIQKALDLFATMPSKKHKLLLAFTDGEDYSGNLSAIKEQAQRMGITIFTIGVGTAQGAPIPVLDEQGNQIGVERDDKNAIVISRLNAGILQTLASDTGGEYLSMTSNDTDVKTIAKVVQKYEKEQFDEKKIAQLREQYPYFLAVSFICFALEWIL